MQNKTKRSVFSFLKPYWVLAILAPAFMLIEVWTDLKLPQIMARIVDVGIANGDMNYILKQGLQMIGYTFIGLIGGVGCFYFSIAASESHASDLREGLFRKVQAFSFHNLDHFKTGSLVTRLTNDVEQVKNMVSMALRMMARAPMLAIGAIIMSIRLSPKLSTVFIVSIPILIVIITIFIMIAYPKFRLVRKKLDRVNVIMQENLAGVRVVKAFVRANHENERFGKANKGFREIATKVTRIMSLAWPLFSLVFNATIIAVLYIGGVQISIGGLTTGTLLAFVQYINRILFALMMISFFVAMAASAKAAIERINEVLDEDITIKDPTLTPEGGWPEVSQGRVEFKNVTFRYEAGEGDAVLKDITFTANPGETVAILGATGSGKSTLVHLIPRLYDVNEGSIEIDGVNVQDYKLHDLRGAMGVSLQQAMLFSRTIKENIAYGDKEIEQDIITQAAKDAQAMEFIDGMDDGMNSQLSQRGVNLSGGQKQRLAIARALAKHPKILIFDDSTSAVDVATEVKIRQALKERAKDTTCFIVAQRISSVMTADKILLIDDGQIVAQGDHEKLMKESEIYRDIYDSQLGSKEVEAHG